MPSKDATPKSPRLHDIDTSSAGGVSGPFWDASDRCFWLMNNRQIYTHPENYSGSSACATIASANPDSAYPSGWSRGQRTRSLSGSDTSPNSASHESKRIRPDSLGGVPVKSTGSKQHSRKGTPEQQRKFPQYDLSNLPPPPPSLLNDLNQSAFPPNISYSDDPVRNCNPGASQPSFPQRSQSVPISNEREQIFTRSSSQSPLYLLIFIFIFPPQTPPYSYPLNLNFKLKLSTTINFSIKTYLNIHLNLQHSPPKHPLHSPPMPPRPRTRRRRFFLRLFRLFIHFSLLLQQIPHLPPFPLSSRDCHEFQRLRTHHRRIEYDYDTDNEISDQKEKKLRRQKSTRARTAEEQKKHEKTLKSIGETGRGDMGRAAFLGALPFVCLLAKLAA